MSHIGLLPVYFLHFWFVEVPREAVLFFFSFNKAFTHMFSIKMLLQTFFQPIKNEYREGLVRFSIGMGMLVKLVVILTWLTLMIPVIAIELLLLSFIVGFPFVVTILAIVSVLSL